MKVGKPVSKRVPVRLRHKIQKASAAKQKKQRKEEKKNPQWRSRLKKDPGIPNLFPYKAKVLAEIEESKRRKEEEIQRRRDVAKAQKQGIAVRDTTSAGNVDGDDDELLDDGFDGENVDVDEDMEVMDESNPMAALLASAQARAKTYDGDGGLDVEDADDGSGSEDAEWGGINETAQSKEKNSDPKKLPRQALEDPIKAVTKLVDRMQDTPSGLERLMEYYQIPSLVATGTDFTTRYLVEVARKRGRLGRSGIPNLHAAALIILSDLHESRLVLPAVQVQKSKTPAMSSGSTGEVQIVSTLAEPFKLEGLWGDDETDDAMNG